MSDRTPFYITDAHLSFQLLADLLYDDERKIALSESAIAAIQRCRNYLDERMAQSDEVIYGINTGFGFLQNTRIIDEDLEQLQENLIRSHACGTGQEVPREIVRLMIVLKLKSLSFGHSGVRLKTAQRLADLYNHDVTPVIYTQGSLGASGDLAPLAHLCLPLLGEGEVYYRGKRLTGRAVLDKMGWSPLRLRSKEGLALLNGTQFMLAYAVHILQRAHHYARMADRIAALSLDGFACRPDPFHPLLHDIRPHNGQIATARAVREFLTDSEIIRQPKQHVQDPYSFRCIPQVHGAGKDALDHVSKVALTEVNSTTDNPNIFVDADEVLSGGNFHGQPLALVLDYLAIALAEWASISERRVFQLLSGARGLPPFLVANPGLNSGLMIAQYTAASIVSQNKQYCTPASVDTIPSSNGQEDHVSMGANSAVKCLHVLNNLRTVLAIELLTASQALWFREPLKTGKILLPLLEGFRHEVPPVRQDRILQHDITAAAQFIDKWPTRPST
ncbi:MAG: histidine ammonia-lyase [Bacteroidota bacterium]